jgi:hypothetical protein
MFTRIRDAFRFLGVLVAAVVSGRPVRPRGDEATRSLPGDELVADPKVRWNHAITVRARPADIWPWLGADGVPARWLVQLRRPR